jgi:hypothetical protein
VLPPSPQEILEKRVIFVRHGYPEWLGYSILSVYRYWKSALERDSFGLSDVWFQLARNHFAEKLAFSRSAVALCLWLPLAVEEPRTRG